MFLLTIVVIGVLFQHETMSNEKSYPTIGVSLRLTTVSIENQTASFVFIIKNKSDQCVSFDLNKAAMVKHNLHEFAVETGCIKLAKNQEVSVSFTISQIDFSRENTITVSAISNEGTECTTSIKLPVLQESVDLLTRVF